GCEDIDLRESAPHAREPDDHGRKINQPPGHAALRHDSAGQHEERDGQHRDLADAAGQLLHHRADRQVDPERADEGGQRQRIGDRHADREEETHAEEEDGDIHGSYSTGTCASAPSRGGGPMVRRSTTNRSIMAPLTTIGRYVMPTDSHGNSSTELPQVVWTSFSPQTTMKIAITPINISLRKSE